jgi:hypothetical protein
MTTINLSLPLDTVNAALIALSKLPYEQVNAHIDLIHRQAEPQARAAAEAAQQSQQLDIEELAEETGLTD